MKKKMIWLMLVIIGFVVIIQIYFFSSYLTQYKSIELNQMNKEAIKALYLMKDYFDKEKLTFIKNKKSTFYSFSNRDINSNKDLKNFKLTKKLLNKKFFNNSFALISSPDKPCTYLLVKKINNDTYLAKEITFNESKKRYFRDFIQYGVSFVSLNSKNVYIKEKIFFDGKKDTFFYKKEKDFIDIYLLICDNKYLKVSLDRQFYQVVKKNMIIDSILSTLMILIIFIIFYYLINIFILSKIWHISDKARMIKQKNDLSLRINLNSNDELSQMATWIDNMLDSIQISREKEIEKKDEELDIERKFLQQIIDSWNHSLLVIDENNILKTNRSFQNLFGHIFSLEEKRRKSFLKILLTAKSDETINLKCNKNDNTNFFKIDKCQLNSENRHLITITDISKFGKEIENLEYSATTDSLTGLYNRKGLYKNLLKCYSTKNYGLLLFDLDFFKKINDTYGHQAGDKVLVAFSQLLLEETRFDDIKCRVGGEEFAFIFSCNKLSSLKMMADKIREKTEALRIFSNEENLMKVTVSIGGVLCNNIMNFEGFYKKADENLYEAKSNGRNRCNVTLF